MDAQGYEWIRVLWTHHRGKLVGALAGFFLGILMVAVGFFWAIVIFGLIVGGVVLGHRFDVDRESLDELLDRIFHDRR